MSQSKDQKTEKPTKNRLRKLRKKGQVAKSKDVVSVANLFTLTALLAVTSLFLWRIVEQMFVTSINSIQGDFSQMLTQTIGAAIETLVYVSLPLCMIAAIVAILSNIAQIGFIFSADPISPKTERINPVAGFKRIFSKSNLVEFIKSTLKVCIIGVVCSAVIYSFLPEILKTIYCDVGCVLTIGKIIFFTIFAIIIAVFIVFSIFDAWYQKQNFINQNKMTKQEVKDDKKLTEGNPLIKSRVRSKAREMAGERTLSQKVADSNYLFIDSAGAVVGLLYKKNETPLPKIIFKLRDGTGRNAQAFFEREDKPIIEHREITHYMINNCVEGSHIPSQYITDIAKLMAPYINK